MEYTYLVTGADGHLGSWIVRKLKQKGKSVRGLRLKNSSLKTPIIEDLYYGDVLDINSLKPFFNVEKAKVIHTAAIVSVSKKKKNLLNDVNLIGTKNILHLCKEHSFSLTYISSVHAFVDKDKIINESSLINPNLVIGEYAKSKAEMSLYLQNERKNLPINIIYPSGILGPKDYGNNPLNTVIKDYLDNKLFCYIKGGYDMVDVRDVAKFIVKLNIEDIKNENFIISNTYVKIEDFFKIISKNYNNKKLPIRLPTSIVKILAPISEIYYNIQKKPALISSYSLYTLLNSPYFSHSKASETLGYNPRNIEKTIIKIINNYKNKK